MRDLVLETLADLPAPCRRCTFWERRHGDRGPVVPPDEAADLGPGVDPAKEAWHQAVQLDWGTPGKAIYVEGRLVAYATFAPGAFVPRTATLGPIVSDDAVLLVSLWVDPEHRGGGLGKNLVQAALREAASRGDRALEAYGEPAGAEEAGDRPWRCVAPSGALTALGFELHRSHPRTPLYRLDLRRTARWDAVGEAVSSVLERIARRERQPALNPGHPSSSR